MLKIKGMKSFFLASVLGVCVTTPVFSETLSVEKFRSEFLNGKLSWAAVEARAREEGEVNLFHWGGSESLNSWIDRHVVPALADKGIKLRTTRLGGTREAVDLVLTEKQSGRGVGEGSVDAIWLNGDNFYTLSQQNALFGSFANKLPNSVNFYFDPAVPAAQLNLSDFGTPTLAQEVPWSGEQYVCYFDSSRLARSDAPSTFLELEDWLKENPGRFTYVKPPHYVGNTFVQSVLYAFNPNGSGAVDFQKSVSDFSESSFAELVKPGFEYLKRIEPFLLGEGSPIYAKNQAANQALFNNGEVDIGCEFGLYLVANLRKTGAFSETTETMLFPKNGMIKNKNFIAIPSNAPNPAAAMVLANVLSSIDLQISKLKEIGYPLGIDLGKLSADDQQRAVEAAPSHHGVSAQELASNAVPDTNASLVKIIQEIWIEYIERNNEKPFEQIVSDAFAKLS
ncbi:ABC transporter substrate-binding protein [Sneathiella glossodoripedis]|uniref:ABC transporter substrate-binding protein n=1 Tax=Sneathiella glossodoripedis TaxID=418853 RepID=UPI00046F4243|nr:ABC transporter substrate-binding protein [Sneathiella glossodoripedis]